MLLGPQVQQGRAGMSDQHALAGLQGNSIVAQQRGGSAAQQSGGQR